jgi:hypothetical protein
MAMTTKSSMSVNAFLFLRENFIFDIYQALMCRVNA